jgi:hypothetical protein
MTAGSGHPDGGRQRDYQQRTIHVMLRKGFIGEFSYSAAPGMHFSRWCESANCKFARAATTEAKIAGHEGAGIAIGEADRSFDGMNETSDSTDGGGTLRPA